MSAQKPNAKAVARQVLVLNLKDYLGEFQQSLDAGRLITLLIQELCFEQQQEKEDEQQR